MGDPGGKIAKVYGVRLALLGLAKRASFVIGSDRRIQYALLDNFDPDAHVEQACSIVFGEPKPD